LIDYGVTSPHVYVFKALQQALRKQQLYAGPIDGIPGPQTRAGLADARLDHRRLYLDVLEYRARHYLAISFDADVRAFLKAHPQTQLHNCAGWLARCWAFVDDAPVA
jgi:hypothetical protein